MQVNSDSLSNAADNLTKKQIRDLSYKLYSKNHSESVEGIGSVQAINFQQSKYDPRYQESYNERLSVVPRMKQLAMDEAKYRDLDYTLSRNRYNDDKVVDFGGKIIDTSYAKPLPMCGYDFNNPERVRTAPYYGNMQFVYESQINRDIQDFGKTIGVKIRKV